MVTRRSVLKSLLSSAILGPLVAGCGSTFTDGPGALTSPGPGGPGGDPRRRPNILFMLLDQWRMPPEGYAANQGEVPGIREILGFTPQLSPDNPFIPFFRGFTRLRKNAVFLRKHYLATAACSPSRTSIMTGQYPSLHGVTQVDGMFKEADEVEFLDPNGVPTVGDWFDAVGYDAYYMGKWHVSNTSEPPFDLTPFGFQGYESSGPEPHGSNPQNLGVYRDPGFGDIVSDFLAERDPNSDKPWFAVASLVNPHDIVAYPEPFFGPEGNTSRVTQGKSPITDPQPIPDPNSFSNPSDDGFEVSLNPDGFPQDTFNLPPGMDEDLSTKPRCQQDAAYKVQMGLKALFPRSASAPLPYPIQNQDNKEEWVRKYGQFYVYLQYLVDLEIRRILDTLDAKGLSDNTIIVFTSDHGEYCAAHGTMVQKWHTAYEEITHVPFVVSSPLVNPSENQVRLVTSPTNHVDIIPTLLGLAGITQEEFEAAKQSIIASGHTQVRDLVGQDLTQTLRGGQSPARPGVLFTTDDRITEPPDGLTEFEAQDAFERFLQDIEVLRLEGNPVVSGPVLQPNSVRCFTDGVWKINRFWDPRGQEADEWEMYHLVSDPNEFTNLVNFATGLLRDDVSVPGLSQLELEAKRLELRALLSQSEAELLLTPV